MHSFIYILLIFLGSCTGGQETNPLVKSSSRSNPHSTGPSQAQNTTPVSTTTGTNDSHVSSEPITHTQSQPTQPTQPINNNDNVAGCTLAQEKNDRLQGSLLSTNCHEVGKLASPLREFLSAAPEQTLKNLSNDYFDIQRSKESMARIDLTLIVKKADGSHFSNFQDFYAWSQTDAARLENMFRAIAPIADSLGLSVHGYRLVIDEIPRNHQPFSWRLFGQEPLGDTVQIAGQNRRGHGPIVDLHAAYSPHHAFRSYLNESHHSPHYKIIQVNKAKAYVFDDINPQAFIHMLAIPKGEYVSTYDFSKKASGEEIQALLKAFATIIKERSHEGNGHFRFISNAGRDANQSQPHLHFHVVRGGGTALGNPAISKHAHRLIKTYTINEILGHIDSSTLVVFDVDATLAWVPKHTWPYQDVPKKSLAEGQQTLSMWQALLSLTSNQTLNPGAKFIAPTARPMSDDAAQDLKDVGLLAPYDWVSAFNPGPTYKNGVLYAAHTNSGELLEKFLMQAQPHYHFKRVIFIDDRLENTKAVYEHLLKSSLGITYSISFWYQGAIHPILNTTIGFNWPLLKMFSNIMAKSALKFGAKDRVVEIIPTSYVQLRQSELCAL